jgi:chemotaxis protein methyltransferase CheR
MSSLPLSPQVFSILSALIEERCGLHYGLADLELLRDKVSTRALEAGFESLLDYYYFLRYEPHSATEFQTLVESLAVGETYFFREFDQLVHLTRRLIPEVMAAGLRPRLWCAASSTGEEPLSVAMLLDEQDLLDQVDLVASDISQRSLDRARSGRFGRRAVRTSHPALVSRYLTEAPDGWRIDPRMVRAIDWRQVNLTRAEEVGSVGVFDYILCRNVLIYFRDEMARKVVENLTAQLKPGGGLMVSVSESLMRFGTSLQCDEQGGVFIYRKAG